MSRRARKSGKRRTGVPPSTERSTPRGAQRQPSTGGRNRLPPAPLADPQALIHQGITLLGRGEFGAAEASFRRAARMQPRSTVAFNCLGIALKGQGKFHDAIAAYRHALGIDPHFAEAHNNLGNAWRDQGQLGEAIQCYHRALEIKADFAEAHNNLGVALFGQDQLDEAILCYHQALHFNPNYVEAHNNLGNALKEQGKLQAALSSLQHALKLRADLAEVHHNLANVYKDMGQSGAAVNSYAQALKLKPNFPEAFDNLGGALMDLGDYDQAVACYAQAIRLKPDFLDAHQSLANALLSEERYEEAVACYRRTADLDSNQALAELRIAALCPTVFQSTGEEQQYRAKFLADARRFAEMHLRINLANLTTSASKPSFNLQFLSGNVRPLKEAYAAIFRDHFPQAPFQKRTGIPRVGMLVTRKHEAIFFKSMMGIVERMYPDLFQLMIICSQSGATRLQAEIKSPAVTFVILPERFDRMVETVRACQLDVLYYWEVGTDTANYFLPFLRLAPVQCTGFGCQTTSGIPEMDYYLSSALVEPDQAEGHYSERLIRAQTLLTYQFPVLLTGRPKTREAFGLTPHQHVYLCAQHLGKIHPDFDSMLAAILRQDGRGTIVITKDRFGYAASQLAQRFHRTMPDVADRILFVPRLEPADYHSLTAAADVLLDPPHFCGVNTTYDGLALGKPIVTLPSDHHRGRYTSGCYRQMGYTECVATSAEDYVNLAVRLGTNRDDRQRAGESIRQLSGQLFEDQEAVRECERIFQELIDQARARCGRA